MYLFNSIQFNSIHFDERTRCMHSLCLSAPSFSHQSSNHINNRSSHRRPHARKPPPDAYRPTAAPAIGRDETPSRRVQKTPRLAPPRPPVSPSQSMSAARWPARVPPLCPCVYPPPCVYPGYTHTPSTPPLDGPGPVDRDTSTGHARGLISHPPSLTTQKNKKKRKEPPSPLHKCKNKHPRGRATSYSTHPRVRPITSRTRVRDG